MEIPAEISVINSKLCFIGVIDPQATTVLVILLLALMILSFVVSGAEVAFFSLTHKDINLLKTKQQTTYKRVVDLLEEPKALLASLIITNSFANIAIIVIGNILLDGITEPEWTQFLIKTLTIVIVLVLFCEILPKIYARQNNIRFAKDFGIVVEAVFYLFKRPGNWFIKYTNIIEKKLSGNTGLYYKMEEIYDVIDITTPGNDENSVKEKDILKGIAKFSNITVKQIMKTRLDISGIDYKTSFREVEKKIEELHYSRLPVYKDDLDKVIGVIHTKDVLPYLNSPDDFNWLTLMRQPYFVHENKLIEDLLKEFQSKHVHFSVVVDEFGGTSGIVTLEDIVEEVIGDIRDEFDEEESGFKKIDDNNYIFDGNTSISDVCKLMHLPVDMFDVVKGDSDSLAGLVLEIAGKIPTVNEVITSGDFDFIVIEIIKNRLKKIKISIKSQVTQ